MARAHALLWRSRVLAAPKSGNPSSAPARARRSVSGFSTHSQTVDGLPKSERDVLDDLAQWVFETHMPGDFPVVRIETVGHCDHDAKGKAFEDMISQQRARSVLLYLQHKVFWLSPDKFIVIPGKPRVIDTITFSSSGVGSKTAKRAVNEQQRKANREVEIFFDRGPVPKPLFDLDAATKKAVQDMMRRLPGDIKPHFFDKISPLPPSKSQFKKMIEWFRNSPLSLIDFKTVGSSVLELMNIPENDSERFKEWTERFADAAIEEERERVKRNTDPPGDPEPEGP